VQDPIEEEHEEKQTCEYVSAAIAPMIAASTVLAVEGEYCHASGNETASSRRGSISPSTAPSTPPRNGTSQMLPFRYCLIRKRVLHVISAESLERAGTRPSSEEDEAALSSARLGDADGSVSIDALFVRSATALTSGPAAPRSTAWRTRPCNPPKARAERSAASACSACCFTRSGRCDRDMHEPRWTEFGGSELRDNVATVPQRGPFEGRHVAIGPVQLIVLGFNHPEFHGEIVAELERLRESDTVRVIDALAVHKDADGEIEVQHLSNLSKEEAIELGSKVGALIGLGIEGEEGAIAGAEAGAEATDEGVHAFSDEEAWDVLEEIPNDSAAALILLEHHWAVPLRDAIARAGGFRISDGFISPVDLIEIGLLTAEEAKEHHLEPVAVTTGS
jgi:uncharacterized membrane protein